MSFSIPNSRCLKQVLLFCISLFIEKDVLAKPYQQTCFVNGERLTVEKLPGSDVGLIKKDRNFFEEHLHCAYQGDAMSQIMVAGFYITGEGGIKKDYREAAKWFAEAAKQDNDDGLIELAHCYKMGWGVPQNYQKAIELYKRSAAQGFPYAKLRLGEMYRDGKGVRRNYIEAYKLFTASGTSQGYKIRDALLLKMTVKQIAESRIESCRAKNLEPNSKACNDFIYNKN